MEKKYLENGKVENSDLPWDLTTKRQKLDSYRSDSLGSDLRDPRTVSPSSSSNFSGSSANCSCSSWNWRPEPFTSFQMNQTSQASNPIDRDMAPRFSGMNLGDVMRITVMKEMDQLKMSNDKPLDLSFKPWDLKKS